MTESNTHGRLLLKRKVGETITLGKDIQITIVKIHDNCVRLSIQAPKTIIIDEAYKNIIEEATK